MKYLAASLGFLLASPTSYVSDIATQPQGYGQGLEKDALNRPTGAVNFNNSYSESDAYALTNDENQIILTFDQGYENGYTSTILDTLKEKNVKAIFFLTGDYAKKETELVKRMIKEGHVLGNHGMTHASFPKLNDKELYDEINSLHEYVLKNYNYEMQYLRPPCGEYSENSLKLTKENGYKTLMWSFAYVDWNTSMQPSPEESLKNALECAHPGAIYLLHSVSATNNEILGNLIDGLREKGYTL